MLEYKTVSALCRAAEESGSAISALVLADQAEQLELDASEVYARMERRQRPRHELLSILRHHLRVPHRLDFL